MVTTKQEKRKRKKTKSRRLRPPPPVGLAGRAPKRADPTSLVLERQQVGTLIKNARTAGVAINQTAYDAYYDTVAMRSLANQLQRPDVYAMQGLEARRHLRNMVLPRGHGGAREVSTPLVPGPTTDTTPLADNLADQHSDASGEIKEEKIVTHQQQLEQKAKNAIDLTTPQKTPRKLISRFLSSSGEIVSPEVEVEQKQKQSRMLSGLSPSNILSPSARRGRNKVEPLPTPAESASDLN